MRKNVNNIAITKPASLKAWLIRHVCRVILFFGCIMPTIHAEGDQMLLAESDFTGPQIDFKSAFLDTTAIITAVFEKESFGSGPPANQRKQIYFLKIDGSNYILGTVPSINSTNYSPIGGHCQDVTWQASSDYAMIFDPGMHNTNNGVSVVDGEKYLRMVADLFVNFGVWELNRKTTLWAGQNKLLAKSASSAKSMGKFFGLREPS